MSQYDWVLLSIANEAAALEKRTEDLLEEYKRQPRIPPANPDVPSQG